MKKGVELRMPLLDRHSQFHFAQVRLIDRVADMLFAITAMVSVAAYSRLLLKGCS
jgi:hypothetical protein